MSKQIESVAYHEAAHITAAVVQAMPLRPTGVHIDLSGNGCSDYFHREVGDLGQTELDRVERQRTVIALFAAHAAQLKFYPECDRSGWNNDLSKIRKLLLEMYPAGNQKAEDELEAKSKRLVDDHWATIEELAKTLLSKPLAPLLAKDTAWGIGPYKRNMSGAELVEFFARHNQSTKVVNDDVKNYDSTQDKSSYDSLA